MEQDRLWGLLSELSRQLSSNVSQVELLKRQAEELKTQAVHNSTGFTLKRFNVDISKEQFDSELERLNATLVLENHALQHENKQLSMLLKDYEGTLENVMGRFRTYAYSTQLHHLSVTRHYETLMQQQQEQLTGLAPQHAPPMAGSSSSSSHTDAGLISFQDSVELQAALFRMAELLRKALRASQGEDPSPPDSPTTETDEGGFGIPPPPPQSSAKAASSDLHAKLGGYLALLSRDQPPSRSAKGQDFILDDAMNRDIELERLRQENDMLRNLLDISKDDQDVAAAAATAAPAAIKSTSG